LERKALEHAFLQEKRAAEFRAKEASGKPSEGTMTWAERATDHERKAAWWRGQARWAVSRREQSAELW
jgi:plasmid replication initiation protein